MKNEAAFCSLMNKKGRGNTQNTPLVKPNIPVLEDLSKKDIFYSKIVNLSFVNIAKCEDKFIKH